MAESKRAAASARAGGGAEEKAKALETALAQIKKQFGEGAVMRLGQDSALNVEAIPTGSLSLDLALGIGGVPRGRIIEIYGPESSGKTTLALHCIAEGQKRGGNAAFIDVEHALDPVYAGNLGVENYLHEAALVAAPPSGAAYRDGEGNPVRLLADSKALRDELAAANRPQKEFFTFATERGDTLNAYIVKPRGFDPSHRYPVLLTQYSGPGSQSVRDRWSLDWEDALADKGYIVVCADGRGTGFRGEKFKKQTYGRLGALEVEDQLSLARYMAAQPYTDPARIGIYGWSYGGFMALSCAFKGHGLFKMAIAVAPVTSWRYYDSIYTEIYNNLPQYNASGYDDNSPINFARMLDDTKTRLLIIHGTADDNVHFQNTVEMTRALNRCGKQYDMMVYPDQNHSMQPDYTRQIRQRMISFVERNL